MWNKRQIPSQAAVSCAWCASEITTCMIAPARRNAFEEVLDTAVVSRYYAWHAEAFLRPHRRNGALPLLTKTAAWASVDSPVGGMKESGLRPRPRHGAEGILKCTESQTVAVQRTREFEEDTCDPV